MIYFKALLLGIIGGLASLIAFFVFSVYETHNLVAIYIFAVISVMFIFGWAKTGSLSNWLKEFF